MKSITKSLKNLFYLFGFFSLIISQSLFTGCSDDSIVDSNSDPVDIQTFYKLLDEDETINSFEPNFNEEEALSFGLGKTNTEFYPFRVGQRTRLTSREMEVQFSDDTSALGVVTRTYEGILFISGSFSSDASAPDTLIQKTFTTTVTRNVQFSKFNNSENPNENWKITAVSLAEGQTNNLNINITKISLTFENGEVLEITSPNDYYLEKVVRKSKEIPNIKRNEAITVRIELESAYADTDFVTLTYGSNKNYFKKYKVKFDEISSMQNGSVYTKVYENELRGNQIPGVFHAIINAMPKQTVHDDATPVEANAWGFPYIVK